MKNNMFALLAGALFLATGMQTAVAKASFDCTKAGSAVEKMICDSARLSELDVQLAAAYKKAKTKVFDAEQLLSSQRQWIKQRNLCNVEECLLISYFERLEFLQNDEKLLCADQLTPYQMNFCAGQDLKKVNGQLTRVYQALLNKQGEQQAVFLNKAQTAWLVYREQHCEFEANVFLGDSAVPMIRSLCMTEITEQRIKQLGSSICESDAPEDCAELQALLSGR